MDQPRIRTNAKQTAAGKWQLDVTYEVFDGTDPAVRLLKAIESIEREFTAAGKSLVSEGK